ncbi:hypothetical protein D3C85_274310 [compost metagenome]
MTIIKTSELSGAALDWAVAKAVGLPIEIHPECCGFGVQNSYGSPPECCANPVHRCFWKEGRLYHPSERECDAKACRIIVAAKLGDEVDVPEELV